MVHVSIIGAITTSDHHESQSVQTSTRSFINLIFLPFNGYWQLFLSITILCSVSQSLFALTFPAEQRLQSSLFYYSCELIFFFNVVAIILHRKFTSCRRTRHYKKKSTLLIIICIVSLIPIYETYFLMRIFKWHTDDEFWISKVIDNFNIKSSLRIIFVWAYFIEKRHQVGIFDLFYIMYNHVYNCICLTVVGTTAWYLTVDKSQPNWTNLLESFKFNRSDNSHWMVISFNLNTAFFTRYNHGNVSGTNHLEKVIILLLMTIGHIYQIIITVAELLASFLRRQRHRVLFMSRMRNINYLLEDWNVDSTVKKGTMEYYKIYWQKRHGINTMPDCFNFLPLSLQKEITVDICWDAFRHSKLFSNTDISFKRSVSLRMNYEFLLPGDYVYRAGDSKHKMVYILTGTVELLTEEDNESPFMCLGGGTLLGETSCMAVHKSRINVKCSSYCEIQTLHARDFLYVLLDYKKVSKTLSQDINSRVSYARWATSDEAPKVDYTKEHYVRLPTIETLKNQWKLLMKINRSKSLKESLWKKLDKTFTSNYLDTLVIVDALESDEHKICLQPNCPFIIKETSSFRQFLEYVVLAAVGLQTVILPYYIFFLRTIPWHFNSTLVVLDFIYYLDIYLELATAVRISQEVTLTTFREIVAHKFKQVLFCLDVVSSFPLGAAFYTVGLEGRTAAFGHSIRLWKIWRFFKYLNQMQKRLTYHSLVVQLFKYVVMVAGLAYATACVLYATSCFDPECETDNWYEYNQRTKHASDGAVFHRTFFFAACLTMNYHATDNIFITIPDIIMHNSIIFISGFVFITMFAEMTASASMIHRGALEHQDNIIMFKVILKRRNVDADLKMRLLNILEFNWNFNEGAEIQGQHGILAEASGKIKSRIINERFKNCFRLVPLFAHCPSSLLDKLSSKAQVLILPPNTFIQNVNVMSHNVYVVLRGFCQMNSQLPGDAERQAAIVLKRGDMLALIETLHRLKMFGSIITVTTVELLSIPYELFLDSFQQYRTHYANLQNALRIHMGDYESILMRKGCRLPEMRAPRLALGKVDTFEFTVYMEERKSFLRDQYMKPFLLLGKWKILRFFLFKSTIDPTALPYRVYEMFRYVWIVAEIIMLMLSVSILFEYRMSVYNIKLIGHAAAFIDSYLRMHCQYYNSKGVLVTHPLYTMRNYIRSAFWTDMIANLSTRVLMIKPLIKNDKYTLEATVSLCLRCLTLYRPYRGLSYIQERCSWAGAVILLRLKILVLVMVMLGLIANLYLCLVCDTDEASGTIVCNSGQFTTRSIYNEMRSPTQVFVQCFYLVVSVFTSSIVPVFYMESSDEVIQFSTLLLVMYILRAIVLAICTSSGIGGNMNLSVHQARMRQFMLFSQDVSLDEIMVKDMVAHYEHVWKETLGTDINEISSKFNLYLRTQFVCFLYEESLRNTKLFANAPTAIIQRLVPFLREVHFKKDAQIIRCNDVQGKLFIVHKGKVHISIASAVITSLINGGMFGCFQRGGVTRQTISAVGYSPTILLTLDSTVMYEIMKDWVEKSVEVALRNLKLYNTEYMVTKNEGLFKRATLQTFSNMRDEYMNRYDHYVAWLNKMISTENFWYWLCEYFLLVHISSWTGVVILAYAFIDPHEKPTWIFYMILYSLDCFYIVKTYLDFHIDTDTTDTTGKKIYKFRLIAIRYLKDDFALCVMSWLPFEIIGIYTAPNWIKMFTLNRALRCLFIYRYYASCKNKLTVSKHLRYSYVIYWTLFRVQILVSTWLAVACMYPRCYRTVELEGRPKTFVVANTTAESVLLGYTYVINLLTRGGSKDMLPRTTAELLVSMGISIYSFIMLSNLAREFANIIIIHSFTRDKYEYKISKIKIYLQGRQLSRPIFKKIWEYYLQLWALQQGEWIPRMISLAPPYLKQDVLNFLYGYHLQNHFLFSKTHKDFIRQIVALLQRRVYLPGNVIVEKGDIDTTMYFVHSGEIAAYDKHGGEEIQCFILRKEMSFGEAQGMYGIPFHVSYRALTIVTVLALEKKEWDYLLKWFPASNEEINAKAREYGLGIGVSYYHKELG